MLNFFSFSQKDNVLVNTDSVYILVNTNLLSIPQGEVGVGLDVMFHNYLAVEFGIGKTWENYQYSILEGREVYEDYLGRQDIDAFESQWEGMLFKGWMFNLVLTKYFNISKDVLPFISTEYKWKNVFSVVSHAGSNNAGAFYFFNTIYGRQNRSSNKFSLYGGICTNQKLISLKFYGGVFMSKRNIYYPELIYDEATQNYSFNKMSFSDKVVGLELGLKIGLGFKVGKKELVGL
jgi:hypothetical protein